MDKQIKLSLCMILKNEGKTIYRCLDSIHKIGIVDEWIIGIDDKCTDDTESEVFKFFNHLGFKTESSEIKNHKVIHEYINKEENPIPFQSGYIYPYTWPNSFSQARNEGMDKATGDFIFIMDGHEFIPDDFYNFFYAAKDL